MRAAIYGVIASAVYLAHNAGCVAHVPQDAHQRSGNVSQSHFSSDYEVLDVQPHQPAAFTQGWLIDQDTFFESSGLYGHSYVVSYDRANKEIARYDLPKYLFAEGLADDGEHLLLLSWQKGKAIKLDKATLKPVGEFRYRGQGWGLTHTGEYWLKSNGSDTLYFRDNDTFDEVGHITVTYRGESVRNLNELEYAQGLIWANVWQEPFVLAIDPKTGDVIRRYDLSPLVETNTKAPAHETLNGIAFDQRHDAFWLTGKHWLNRYLIRFKQPSSADLNEPPSSD